MNSLNIFNFSLTLIFGSDRPKKVTNLNFMYVPQRGKIVLLPLPLPTTKIGLKVIYKEKEEEEAKERNAEGGV